MSWLTKFVDFFTGTEKKKVRARNDKGHYVADDKSTPDVNEAYTTKRVLKNILRKYNLEIVETISDTHIISMKYFFIKINAIVPFLRFLTTPLIKIKFFNNLNIKINLGDLDIYCVKKTI